MGVGDVPAFNARQPDNFAQAEHRFQLLLHPVPAPARITVRIHPAAFGHDAGAVPVHFDTAAFAYQCAAAQLGGTVAVGGKRRRARIFGMPLFIAPAVEVEIHRPEFAGAVDDEIGAEVAHPDVIQLGDDIADIVTAAGGLGQLPFTLAAKYRHRLKLGDGTGDTALRRLHIRREFAPDSPLRAEGEKCPLLRLLRRASAAGLSAASA